MTSESAEAIQDPRGPVYARFGADGRLEEADPAIFTGGREALVRLKGCGEAEVLAEILEQFRTIDGAGSGDPGRIHAGIHAWRVPGAQIEATRKDGAVCVLSSVDMPTLGRCYLVHDIRPGRQPDARFRRREPEKALAILTDVVETLDIGVTLIDADLRLVFANRRAAKVFFGDAPPPRPGERFENALRRLLDAGFWNLAAGMTADTAVTNMLRRLEDRETDFEIRPADGRILICSVHSTALGGYLLVISDESTRRHAEREADELIRTIVEASPTTFLVSRVDDGKIIYCPPASYERFGHLETTLGFFLDPRDREEYLAALLPTGRVDDYPVRFRRGDGSIMDGLTSARVIDYKGEKAIVSSTRDITQHLAMEAELHRQREKALQSEKLSALGELLAGVAHELNNPLSIVVGYALMLQDKIGDPALKRRVERIGQAAERCAKIVRTFLAMARQRPANLIACSLNEVLETALDVAGFGLRGAGGEIVCAFDPDLPRVRADPDQLAQVFTNLIVNAEHAMADMADRARLTVRTSYDAATEEVIVEICDNGAGISRDLQRRIFEPFFTTKEVGTGTGVGLAFSHRIVDAHGGSLTVRSEPGHGASFFVRLKAVVVGEAAAPDGPAPDAGAAHRVLIVDDEPGICQLIADVLEDGGCTVTALNDAREALRLLKDRKFDAILSDFRMPGYDGGQFLADVIARHPGYAGRIALVTGDAMSPRVADFVASTDCPCLEKPVVPDELTALVDRLCECAPGERP